MDLAHGADEFRLLSIRLKAAGETGLRRELSKAISAAAVPVAEEIGGIPNLNEHMPDRYAAVLARDLRVTTRKSTSLENPGVTLTARAPTLGRGGRAVRQRDEGVLGHPVFGRRSKTNPRMWANWEYQEDGMKAGFFSGPAGRAAPQVRQAVLKAMGDVADQVTGKA